MLLRAGSYERLYRDFRWSLPERYNIGVDACDKWAEREPERLALIHRRADGGREDISFGALKRLSNRLANALAGQGVARGDRVGVLLPQTPETAVAHLAIYKLGAIAVPLFVLFGPEALEYRLANAGAKAVITDAEGVAKLAGLRAALPALSLLLSIDGPDEGALGYAEALEAASDSFAPADTRPDDPAVIIYTSGTTGPPKGALHGHRVLLGHLPGVELPQDFLPQPGDLFWTPADWAWIGGLYDVLLPALHHGVPVLASRQPKFDPEAAFALMAEVGVRNAFMPPTALKLMRKVEAPRARWNYRLRSIGSGGETLGEELLDWGREAFGLTINEFYGQTECNLVLSNCAGLMPVKPGAMGRPVPGHRVAIVDEAGQLLPAYDIGQIAVRAPDPVMFLGYWNDPEATEAKFAGDWLMTGDLGKQDSESYFHYVGREDDVISSAGYRIGPGEVEDCLLKHPAVAMAAVVGVADPERGQRIKAFLVLQDERQGDAVLAEEIRAFVRARLAAHEYPREVAFVEALPMTATGKIIRRALRAP